MPDLPARPDLRQLRMQAKELLKAARAGDSDAVARIEAVSDRLMLASAQLALARSYGFPSWPRLKAEVERRELLNRRDLKGLRALLEEHPELAVEKLEHWSDHRRGATPLGYVAMLRFDAPRLGLEPVLDGTDAVARMLLAAGAPVEGDPDDRETPLITAASYGDADVARVLIDAGAEIDVLATGDAGGVPGGSALLHAAVFGNTEVVDVLAAAGARVRSLVEAAAVGNIGGRVTPASPLAERVLALTMAAAHDRVEVIEELLGAGTPVDALDGFGRRALQAAAENGRPGSVSVLLAAGADPQQRDPNEKLTPLEWARRRVNDHGSTPGHEEVQRLLGAGAAR
jgi:ankyrin repeat protein